jgi:hypothetical protein
MANEDLREELEFSWALMAEVQLMKRESNTM